MVLKQCRVPRTFSFPCFATNARTSSRELAEYRRSVPYSRLPDQFFSLSSGMAASSGEMIGVAIIAEESLINVLLFMVCHLVASCVKTFRDCRDLLVGALKSGVWAFGAHLSKL